MNCPTTFLDWHNKTKLVASFFLWNFLWSVTVLTVIISLNFNKTKQNKLFYSHCSFTKTLCQINQEILTASKNNCNSSKAFELICPYLATIYWRRSTGCFIYSFVIQVISEKTLCSKDFTSTFTDIFTWK